MADNAKVDAFIKRVENLFEVEYGDFKRKVGLYINELEKGLPRPVSAADKKVIAEMKARVVFQPRPDVELGRQVAIELAKKLRH